MEEYTNMNTVKKINVSNEQLTPRVLKSFLFTHGLSLPVGYRLRERYVYDYEFELISFSNGSMLIDENEYHVKKGDIVFRKPGQFTQGIMQYSCYLVCLDMLNNTGKNAADYDFYEEHVYQNYIVNEILDSFPTVFNPRSTEKYKFLFDSILEEFINPTPGSELVQKASALNLIYQLFHDVTNPFLNASIPLSPHYAKIKQVIEYINNNIGKKMLLEELSNISGLSPNHFHKIFSKTMGTTLNSYVTKVKIDKAKELLIKSRLQIAEISFNCGFDNIPYFSSLFKKQVGISPGEYRKRHSYQ